MGLQSEGGELRALRPIVDSETIEEARVVCSSRALALDLDRARALALDLDRDLARALDLALDRALDRALARALALALDLARDLDRALDLALDRDLDLRSKYLALFVELAEINDDNTP